MEGERCFILSCGPSMGDLPIPAVRDALANELVIAVKQSYDLVRGVADIHILNTTSLKHYDYPSPKPLVISERGALDAPQWGVDPDIEFLVHGTDGSLSMEERLAARLAVRENYDDYLFERTLVRPWGPGVILEIGMYLAVHIGVSELIVAGWDLGAPGDSIYDHYYRKARGWEKGALGHIARRVLRRGPFLAYQYLRLRQGKMAYAGTVEPDDTAVSIASSYGMSRWLSSHGVELKLLSGRSHLDERIPRVTWTEVVEQLESSQA